MRAQAFMAIRAVSLIRGGRPLSKITFLEVSSNRIALMNLDKSI